MNHLYIIKRNLANLKSSKFKLQEKINHNNIWKKLTFNEKSRISVDNFKRIFKLSNKEFIVFLLEGK